MSLKISYKYSPNFSTYRRIKKNIKYLILHYTGMRSESKAINRLIDVKSNVSCHYFVKRNGSIILMVPETYSAWHAGVSRWKKDKFLNKKSIGIEISNKGHRFGYQSFTKNQIKTLLTLIRYLIKKYNIKDPNILGHSDIAFERKKDPGEKFPWEYLAKKKIGLWHKISKKKLNKIRKDKLSSKEEILFFRYLSKIGYFVKKNNPPKKVKLIKSFQRHFRQILVDGKIDQECLLIAQKLSKIVK